MFIIYLAFLYTYSWKIETLGIKLVSYNQDTSIIPTFIISFKSGWGMGSIKTLIYFYSGILKCYTALK